MTASRAPTLGKFPSDSEKLPRCGDDAGADGGDGRAPIGFLHDTATALYPFLFEPLASLSKSKRPPPFRDLGIGAGGTMRDAITRRRERELEAVTPAALVSCAARGVLSMLAGDDMLRPLSAP